MRIQACWAIGNLFVDILPYRWQVITLPINSHISDINSTDRTHNELLQSVFFLQDDYWIYLYEILVPMLHDSEKILATVVRCIGFVAAG